MSAEAALRPIASTVRIELVDILRGFALLGVLVVNFWGSPGPGHPRLDRAVDAGLVWLAEDSFWPLFSFLFGLGFAIQLQRARELGAPVVAIYVRRMLALLLIGTASILVGVNLVLLRYALLGLLLVPVHRLPLRAVLALIVMLFAFVPRRRGPSDDVDGAIPGRAGGDAPRGRTEERIGRRATGPPNCDLYTSP